MALFFAVSITLAVFTTQIVISTIVAEFLVLSKCSASTVEAANLLSSLAVMLCSVVWMAVDSRRIKLSDYEGLICRSPAILALSGAFLWIVVFPCYLNKRWQITHGTAKLKSAEKSL